MLKKFLPLVISIYALVPAALGGVITNQPDLRTSVALNFYEMAESGPFLLIEGQIRHEELLDAKMTAEEYLKTTTPNPSSLEIIREEADFGRVDPQKAYIIVRVKYRAKNHLGSLRINEKVFVFDNKLNLKSVQPM
ncbi:MULTISPECIES: hypothetical protein [unclassified Spirosoma]|uniref:hypothetical protein n=1 Tax=unclassified Spirosoma TaxID=2621999 RepID=UPI00095DA9FB|nr:MULTISPECIES: hypothetical protein [unclassified Spirosoma]MBN8825137.1 hypothetical protein [Spirosoma sp.]OJW77172.1 MAG: hypothetical protein BGO59_31450 [Spirosoma sp. 48-14]